MIKILVCIKQVPVSDAPIEIHDAGSWAVPEEGAEYRINRYDECALEEALQIRDAGAADSVAVASVGPLRVEAALRRALGMGADRAAHVITDGDGFVSPFVVAGWLAALAKREGADLIFTGMLSEDLMQGQVGVILSELLGWPCAAGVIDQRLKDGKDRIRVEREIEGGSRECLEMDLPAVLTIQTGINRPRYPSLSNMLRANRTQIETIDSASLGEVDPRQIVAWSGYPARTRAGRRLAGDTGEQARELCAVLREKAFF